MENKNETQIGQIVKAVLDAFPNENQVQECSQEERVTFANLINFILKEDPSVQNKLPIKTEDDDLFDKLDDGIIICKLMIKIDEELIFEKAIAMTDMDQSKKKRNLQMGISAAKTAEMKIGSLD